MATKSRYRLQYKFWLNQYDEEEKFVSDIIEWLKTERDFTKAIRDGLRLVWDLRQGRVGVLLELFPQVREWLNTPEPNPSDDLKDEIKELKRLLLERGDIPKLPDSFPQMKPLTSQMQSLGGPKPLAVLKLSSPVFDDDDDLDTVVLKRSTSTEAAANLFNAMLGLQQ